MDTPLELPRDRVTLWDEHVPIIKNGKNSYTVYFTDIIEVPACYNKLIHLLEISTNKTTFRFVVNNGGGSVDTAIMVVDAMKRTKATIHSHCTGLVASAATVIVLQSDTLTVADHSAFMIHNYSGSIGGKGGEIESHQKFMTKNLKAAFTDYYTGFLTPREITSVIKDNDKWLSAEEVRSRWINRKSFMSIKEKTC